VRLDDVERTDPDAAKMVFSRCDDLKMVWVHAGRCSTQMVDVLSVWNVPTTKHDGHAMRALAFTPQPEISVSVRADGAVPDDTT
jgi:hypothetical protein